jgi:hypothetical protein
LVSVLGVHTKAHVNFNGFVEFGEFDFLGEANGFGDGINPSFDLLGGGQVFFSLFLSHDRVNRTVYYWYCVEAVSEGLTNRGCSEWYKRLWA